MALIGKNVLITGGANGIGLGTAKVLLDQGVTGISLLDINENLLNEEADKLKQAYPKADILHFKVNVANEEDVKNAYKLTIEVLKSLDIVVNSAGISSCVNWEATIDVNFKGVVNSILCAFNVMGRDKGGNGGTIVNISSIGAVVLVPYCPVYSATKYAVSSLTRTFGNEIFHKKNGISVMAVCPGSTETGLTSGYDVKDRFFNEDCEKDFKKMVSAKGYIYQSPEAVGKCVLEALLDDESGSIWLIKGNVSQKLDGKKFDTPFN